MLTLEQWDKINIEKAYQRPDGYTFRGPMRNPDYILYLNQQLKKPFVFIELTSKCNFKCYYCNSNISIRPKGFMDQRLFYHIVDQLESISAYRVALHVDGEPTLHPKFEKFISYLNLKKIPISLATNGSLLKESYLKLEYDLLTYLSASAEDFNKRSSMNFDEYNEKLSAYLRKWKELPAKQNIALQVYLDACDSLGGDEVKQKLEFVHCLLSQAGFSEVEFREDMNCFFTFRKSSGYRFTISFISIVSGGLFPVGQPLERAELPKVSAEAGFCDSGWFRMTIFWDGSLGLCCHGIQGETVYTRPEEIWEKSLAWLWLEHPNANLFRKAMSNGRLVLKGCKKCLSRYPNREFYVQRTTFIPKSQVNLGEYHKIDPTYKDNTYAIFGFVPDVANNIVWSVGRRSQFGFRIDSLSEAAYTLEIEGIGFAPEELGSKLKMSVLINGINVGTLTLAHKELRTYCVDFFTPRNIKGILVTLEFQERKSPYELGIGKDMRRLGLGISRFRVKSSQNLHCRKVNNIFSELNSIF